MNVVPLSSGAPAAVLVARRSAAMDPNGDPSIAVTLAVALAAIHLLAGRLSALHRYPRSRVLSTAGGASVAYVFVHVLPEIGHAEEAVGGATAGEAVYLAALGGFVTYYGLEQFVRRSADEGRERNLQLGRAADEAHRGGGDASSGVFWLHIGSFAVYNWLIGYLLFHREAPGVGSIVLFGVAMALHFVVNDYGLREHHEHAYRRVGRWTLAGAVLVGAATGAVTDLGRVVLGLLFAFVAGGVVLNVIKEELPPERESRFSAFVFGAGGYALLLLAV